MKSQSNIFSSYALCIFLNNHNAASTIAARSARATTAAIITGIATDGVPIGSPSLKNIRFVIYYTAVSVIVIPENKTPPNLREPSAPLRYTVPTVLPLNNFILGYNNMRNLIINPLTKLAETKLFASLFLNRLWCLYWITKYKNFYMDKFSSYDGFYKVDINTSPPNLNDNAINFMIRVLLEKKYTRIVEIGAHSLQRSIHIARLFPEIEVVALDIISEFDVESEKQGVTVGPFSTDWFATHKGLKTLVLTCGTLSYFKPPELLDFLKTISHHKYDLALVELGSHFAKTVSLRRSITSYYHPYIHLLKQVGFIVENTHTPNHIFSLSGMENREYILAITDTPKQ